MRDPDHYLLAFKAKDKATEAIEETVEAVANILQGKKKVILVATEQSPEIEKRISACKKTLEEENITFKEQEEDSYNDSEAVYIDFIEIGTVEAVDSEKQLVIFVPIKEDSEKSDALKLSVLATKGLWVGLGRGENAALCAAKIIKGTSD